MMPNTPASERALLLRLRQGGALLRSRVRPLCAAAFALLFSLALLVPQSAHAQTDPLPTITVSPASITEGGPETNLSVTLGNIPKTDTSDPATSFFISDHIVVAPGLGDTELATPNHDIVVAANPASHPFRPHTVSRADFLNVSGDDLFDPISLSIPDADTTFENMDIDINTFDDDLVEATEYITICWAWNRTDTPSSDQFVCTQVAILDNDTALIALTGISLPEVPLTEDQTIAEGETTTYTLTMVDQNGAEHPAGASVEVQVAWEIDGKTGSSGLCSADTTCEALAGRTGTVTFAPGQTSVALAVNAPDSADDYAHDDATDFWALELGALTCAGETCGATDQANVYYHPLAQGRKRDFAKQLGGGVGGGDAAEPAPLSLGISVAGPTSVEEGNPARFVLNLAGGVSTQDVAITYRINNIDVPPGSAPSSADYGAPESPSSGLAFPASGEMTLSAGTQRATFEIPLTLDMLAETDESFSVELLTATGGNATGVEIARSIVTITILNVENTPYVLRISGPATVAEGGTAAYRVFTEDDVSSSRQVVVTYRIEGTATSNRDSTQFLNTVSSLVNPPDPEPDYEAPAGATAQCSGMEAGGAVPCSATSTDNTIYLEGTVAIPADQSEVTLSIPTLQDLVDDDDETLIVRLVSASGGSTLSPPEISGVAANIVVTTTITDDDTAPVHIDLTLSDTSILESEAPQGGQVITVTATLRPGATRGNADQTQPGVGPGEDTPTTDTISLEEDVTVQLFVLQDEAMAVLAPYGGIKLAVQAGSPLSQARCAGLPAGNECDDFEVTGTDGTATLDMPAVVIRAGRTSATASFNLNLLNDEVVEMDEAIVVDGTASGTTNNFEVHHDRITIESEDEAFLTVSVAPNPSAVDGGRAANVYDEGETLDFTVTLSHQVDGMVEVDALSRCGSWTSYRASDAECKTHWNADPRPAFKDAGTGATALEEPDFADVASISTMTFAENVAPADRMQAFSVRLTDDDYSELAETFHLALSNPVLLPPSYLATLVATAWDSDDAARDIGIGRHADGAPLDAALCNGCSADAVIAASDPIIIEPVAPGQDSHASLGTAWVREGDTAEFGVRLVNGDGGGRVLPSHDLSVRGTVQRNDLSDHPGGRNEWVRTTPSPGDGERAAHYHYALNSDDVPTFYGAEGCTVPEAGVVGARAIGRADYARFDAGSDTSANSVYTAGMAGLPAQASDVVTWTFRGHGVTTPAGAPALGELTKTRAVPTCENLLDEDDHDGDAAYGKMPADRTAEAFYTDSRRRFYFDLYGAAGGAGDEDDAQSGAMLSIAAEEVTTVILDDDRTPIVTMALSKNSLREQDADDNGAGGDDSLTLRVSLLHELDGSAIGDPDGTSTQDPSGHAGQAHHANELDNAARFATHVTVTLDFEGSYAERGEDFTVNDASGALVEGDVVFTIPVGATGDDTFFYINVLNDALDDDEDWIIDLNASLTCPYAAFAPPYTATLYPGVVPTCPGSSEDPTPAVQFAPTLVPPGVFDLSGTEGTIELIDDDDPNIQVSFTTDEVSVDEGTALEFVVRLSADPERPVAIPLLHRGVNGATPWGAAAPCALSLASAFAPCADYTFRTPGLPGAYTPLGSLFSPAVFFSAGQTEQRFTIDIRNDNRAETQVQAGPPGQPPTILREGVLLGLDLAAVDDERFVAGDNPTVTVTFNDDDFAPSFVRGDPPAPGAPGNLLLFRANDDTPLPEVQNGRIIAYEGEEITFMLKAEDLDDPTNFIVFRTVNTNSFTPAVANAGFRPCNLPNEERAKTAAEAEQSGADGMVQIGRCVFSWTPTREQVNNTNNARANTRARGLSDPVYEITVQVIDQGGNIGQGTLFVQVKPGHERLAHTLELVLASYGRMYASRSLDAISSRIFAAEAKGAAAAAGPELMLGGRALPLGAFSAGGRGGGAGSRTGFAAPFLVDLAGAFGLRLPDASLFSGGGADALRAPGAVPGLDAWNTPLSFDGGVGASRAMRSGRTGHAWADDFRSADVSTYLDRVASWRRVSSRDLLNGASFAFSVGEEGAENGDGGMMEGDGGNGEGGEGGMEGMEDAPLADAPKAPLFGRYNVWGRIDIDGFESEPETGIALSGEGVSSFLGVDFHPRDNVLLGVAISHSDGEVDFSNSVDQLVPGTWELEITSAMPYMHITPSPGLGVFGMVGFGSGSAELTLAPLQQTRTDAQTLKTDLEMQMAALGMRNELRTIGEVELSLKADAFVVDLVSKESAELPEVSGDATRMRLVLEGSRSWRSDDTQRNTTLSMEVGARRDGGDADQGLGAEVGMALQYRNTESGLSVRLSGHSIVMHAEDEFREWGASFDASYDPGVAGEGFYMTLQPTWGSAPGGARGVFENDDLFERASASGKAHRSVRFRPDTLDAGFGYHLRLLGDRGALEPFAVVGLNGADSHKLRIGTRVSLSGALWRPAAATPGAMHIELFGERRTQSSGAAERRLGLDLQVRF